MLITAICFQKSKEEISATFARIDLAATPKNGSREGQKQYRCMMKNRITTAVKVNSKERLKSGHVRFMVRRCIQPLLARLGADVSFWHSR